MRKRLPFQDRGDASAAGNRIHGIRKFRKWLRRAITAECHRLLAIDKRLYGSPDARPVFHLPRNGTRNAFACDASVEDETIREFDGLTHASMVA